VKTLESVRVGKVTTTLLTAAGLVDLTASADKGKDIGVDCFGIRHMLTGPTPECILSQESMALGCSDKEFLFQRQRSMCRD
jgi:hypothetical protein